ncbi:MAG: extracellular solute-binding protein [Erysipelotrichaceae bacterium]|nr:extracellular solute-binding protein [Erysipelotrichaceae bacterium]
MKRLFKVLAVLLLALTMFGCSKPTETPEEIEIVIWHTFTDAQNAELEKIAADFSAAHDDINVVVEQQPYADFDAKVANAVRSQVGPSMIIHYSTLAASYADEDLLIDFIPFITEDIGLDVFQDNVIESAYADATQFDSNTKMYVYPLNVTANILFYNKTMFDELAIETPTTWTALTEASKNIYAEKGIPGFGMDSLTDNFILWLNQNNIPFINAETKTVGFKHDTTLELVNWFAEGVNEGYFSVAPTGNYYSEDIGAQTIAAYIGSCAGASYVEASVGDKFEWAMAPVPQTEGTDTVTTAFLRGIIGFSKDAAHDKALYEFIKYWTTPDVHASWCAAFNALSPYFATTESQIYIDYLANNESMAIAQQGVEFSYSSPSLPGSATVRTEIDSMMKKVALNEMTAEDAVRSAVDNSNAALAE